MAKTFTLDYYVTDKWHVGSLREVPGVISQGKTLDELKENIRDAYELMMESYEEDLPKEEMRSVEMEVRPD